MKLETKQKLQKWLAKLLVLTMVVTLAPVMPDSTGKVQEKVKAEEESGTEEDEEQLAFLERMEDRSIYLMEKSNRTSFAEGEQIMFVPDDVTEDPTKHYRAGIPHGSATLKVNPEAEVYVWEDIDVSLDVIQAATGFDWCRQGSLNKNCTEYNSCGGAIQGYKGSVFEYTLYHIIPQ